MVVLHSDLNNFYATVEKKLFPELEGKPIAVCGDKEMRHGIVLAKSEEAKRFGVKTGDVIWEAKRKCPGLIIRPVRFGVYEEQSRAVREIYGRFTDLVEPFGIDECWLDVTHSKTFGTGEEIAEKIRRTVKEERGLTVSVGVSFNKVFAKLASDLKKPDAVTVVSRENYREKIWPLPVSQLLFVGKASTQKLKDLGITTIGQLAAADRKMLSSLLGKWGETLSVYARGEDDAPVRGENDRETLKSVGNSITHYEDITDRGEIKRLLYVLSESVAARMRDAGLGKADTVHLWLRDCDMGNHTCQKKVRPTALCGDIAEAAYALFCEKYRAGKASPRRGSTSASSSSRSRRSRAITTSAPAPKRRWQRSAKSTAIPNCSAASCTKIPSPCAWTCAASAFRASRGAAMNKKKKRTMRTRQAKTKTANCEKTPLIMFCQRE